MEDILDLIKSVLAGGMALYQLIGIGFGLFFVLMIVAGIFFGLSEWFIALWRLLLKRSSQDADSATVFGGIFALFALVILPAIIVATLVWFPDNSVVNFFKIGFGFLMILAMLFGFFLFTFVLYLALKEAFSKKR